LPFVERTFSLLDVCTVYVHVYISFSYTCNYSNVTSLTRITNTEQKDKIRHLVSSMTRDSKESRRGYSTCSRDGQWDYYSWWIQHKNNTKTNCSKISSVSALWSYSTLAPWSAQNSPLTPRPANIKRFPSGFLKGMGGLAVLGTGLHLYISVNFVV